MQSRRQRRHLGSVEFASLEKVFDVISNLSRLTSRINIVCLSRSDFASRWYKSLARSKKPKFVVFPINSHRPSFNEFTSLAEFTHCFCQTVPHFSKLAICRVPVVSDTRKTQSLENNTPLNCDTASNRFKSIKPIWKDVYSDQRYWGLA
jgi:hypothetical protein